MDKRIFVEKKEDFQVKAESLVKELNHNLQLETLKDLRIIQVYDVFSIDEGLIEKAEKHIFSEQVNLSSQEASPPVLKYNFISLLTKY